MKDEKQDELISNAINNITEKLSILMLEEFIKLPQTLQMNLILMKSSQLLLANIICHVTADESELSEVVEKQGAEVKELTLNCAITGFSDKFKIQRH
ncbi:MAG: hypothetical protein H0W64_01210 [Gammaproteobacteria bacterium]|nr:hypothetical protein [Gammaproteobacteria bacterium]